MSLNNWVEYLGLTKGEKFKQLLNKQPKLTEQYKKLQSISKKEDNEEWIKFASTCRDLLRSSVLSALKGLKSISELQDRYVIYTTDYHTREATDHETALIIQAEKYVAEAMGYLDRTKAIKGNPKGFYSKVITILQEEIPNIEYYLRQYKLITATNVLDTNISDYTALSKENTSVKELPEPKFKIIKGRLIQRYSNTLTKKNKEWKPYILDTFELG